ncbi:MAG TPA: hypothetical protein VG939_13460 [Caulobacteraceae bacterium]|nr:hypothetical protein [Caulobacteraceae bacterium]
MTRPSRLAPFLPALFLPALVLLAAGPARTAEPAPAALHVTARIPGPDGGWDLGAFDAARRRVYLTHGTSLIEIDADTGKANMAFAAGDHLHGVVAVPGTDVLVMSSSADDTARLIDARDGRTLASIPVAAKDADGVAYDPATGDVVVISADGGALTLIDPRQRKAVGSLALGTPLEFGAPDGAGAFYVNLSDADQVAVVDLKAMKVTARYPLPGCDKPTGLAYVSGGRVIADCRNGGVDILDAHTGKALATFTVGGFPDAVLYDAARQLAYVPSALSGTLTVIALAGPKDNTIVATVPTQPGARTGAVDPVSGRVWLPTAQYGPPPAPGQRPRPLPGTFQVLVLDR